MKTIKSENLHFSHVSLVANFAIVFCLAVTTLEQARATIFLDLEPDPLPMVNISVTLPVGYETNDSSKIGTGSLIGEMLSGGTASLSKEAFLDKLGTFGASLDINVANQYTFWNLSFPLNVHSNYDALGALLAEHWQHPRFDQASFEIAKKKLRASVISTLDNDGALSDSFQRRFLKKKSFGLTPFFLENIESLQLTNVQSIYKVDFLGEGHLWAGVVAPEANLPMVEKLLNTVFTNRGSIVRGQYDRQLTPKVTLKSRQNFSKTVAILDKPNLTQTIVSFLINKAPFVGDKELSFLFGDELMVGSATNSYIGKEIRAKRGLAYSVGGVPSYYLGQPSIGFTANPVRSRIAEALEVSAKIIREVYVEGSVFGQIPQEAWNEQWQSFKYSKILGASNPHSRLQERASVVVGALSPELYATDPSQWKVSREQIQNFYTDYWRSGNALLTLVGDAAELKPLVSKFFPEFQLIVVPFKDSISKKGFEKL